MDVGQPTTAKSAQMSRLVWILLAVGFILQAVGYLSELSGAK
jgi:hypothetical protein